MELTEAREDEINAWLDRMADYNLAPTGKKLTAGDLLKVIADIWDERVSQEEMEIVSQILLNTEELIEGQLRETEWIDAMNKCFERVREVP
jgi:hypothetical protein